MERRWYRIRIMKALALVALLLFSSSSHAADVPLAEIVSPQTDLPAAAYRIYSGNTHAHTSNTWSHGA
jgi:hypothetical protein